MKVIRLRKSEIPVSITKFEEMTNKNYPYYQNGSKYALCPTCGSSVQIINGRNNQYQNDSTKIYAAHTRNEINGLNFDKESKLRCINYSGNKNNWQKIYKKNNRKQINIEIEKYINANNTRIAKEIEQIIGFKCVYRNGKFSELYNEIYSSFESNNGLCIAPNQFVPEYMSRLIIEKAGPVKCWGAIYNDQTIKEKITKSEKKVFSTKKGYQFLPKEDVKLVGVLNDDENPTKLIIKLSFFENEIILNKFSAKIQEIFE